MTVTRRQILKQALAASLTLPAGAAARAATGEAFYLGSIAAAHGLLFGTAYDRDVLTKAAFADLYVQQARIFTSNSFLKFDALRPTEGAADFTAADVLIAFARSRNILVRGHNLIWNDWTPDWLRKSSSERIAYWLDRHVEETAAHYSGKLHSWDVVNEPFWPGHGNAEGYRSGPWYSALGKGYVARALKRARAVDANAKLVINESGPEWEVYWNTGSATVRQGLLRLIDDLRDADVPLDAIGLQCHWMPDFKFDAGAFEAYLNELARRGLAIYLTEIDISDAKIDGTEAERDAEVARRYHELISTALKVPQVEIIQTWELSDNATWLRTEPFLGPGGRLPRPLPFDDALQAKPAVAAIADAIRKTRS